MQWGKERLSGLRKSFVNGILFVFDNLRSHEIQCKNCWVVMIVVGFWMISPELGSDVVSLQVPEWCRQTFVISTDWFIEKSGTHSHLSRPRKLMCHNMPQKLKIHLHLQWPHHILGASTLLETWRVSSTLYAVPNLVKRPKLKKVETFTRQLHRSRTKTKSKSLQLYQTFSALREFSDEYTMNKQLSFKKKFFYN